MNSLVNNSIRAASSAKTRARTARAAAAPRERRTQEERSAETQSALVEAAIEMLCDIGYAGTTTSEVARHAGCTTGAMQHHYGSKNQLMLALMNRLTDEFEAAYAGFPQLAGRPLRERCARVVEALAGFYCASRYVAIWELYVGSRCDAALNEMCVANRLRAMAGLEKAWLQVFADVTAPRDAVLVLMDFTVTFLRNYGLNQRLGAARAPERQLEVLSGALETRLSQKGRGAESKAAASKAAGARSAQSKARRSRHEESMRSRRA